MTSTGQKSRSRPSVLLVGVLCLVAVWCGPAGATKPTYWTSAQVWVALLSTPSIHLSSSDGPPSDIHVLGPATKAGDAFQPTRITPLVPFGRPTVANGRHEWSAFNVAARVSVNGVTGEQVFFFCLHPLSAVKTVYPYSRFRLSAVTSDFVIGRSSC